MDCRQIKHDECVASIADKLREKYPLDTIETHVEYRWFPFLEHDHKYNPVAGEVDILRTKQNEDVVFYEFKTTHNNKNFIRAFDQYHRFINVYKPSSSCRGVYISKDVVRRL